MNMSFWSDDLDVSAHFLYAKNQYSKPVKYAGWDAEREAEPKDNNPYDPPGGNYFLSTYDRVGSTPPTQTPLSETHDMLQQIYTKAHTMPETQKKPMQSILTLNDVNGLSCKGNCEIHQYFPDYKGIDYRSTMQRDYKHFHAAKRITQGQREKPWMLHRKCISELTDGTSPKREGIHKFQDDCIEKYYVNRNLKREWFQSYNPATGKYTSFYTR